MIPLEFDRKSFSSHFHFTHFALIGETKWHYFLQNQTLFCKNVDRVDMLPEVEADHSFWPRRGGRAPPPPAPPPGSPPPGLASPANQSIPPPPTSWSKVFSNLQTHHPWLIFDFGLRFPNQLFILTAQMWVELCLVGAFTDRSITLFLSQTDHCPAGVSFHTFHCVIFFFWGGFLERL